MMDNSKSRYYQKENLQKLQNKVELHNTSQAILNSLKRNSKGLSWNKVNIKPKGMPH
jgi:hypothetical protein